MKFVRLRRTAVIGLVGALATLSAGGCSDDDSPDKGSKGGLEKTTINMGTLPIPYAAPIYLAIQKGFFKAEGLEVKPQVFPGGAAALPKLISGDLDMMVSNHVSVISATEKNIKLKIIGEIDTAVPGELPVIVMPNSPIKQASDLKGKKIALNTLKNLGELSVTSVLQTNGVDVVKDKVQFVEMPFPNMPAALKSGQIHAAWVAEPFLTQANKQYGTRSVVDSFSGATDGLPLDGYATTEKFVKNNPNTVAAFKRAIAKAQQLAATDQQAVKDILPTYAKIDKETAAIIKIGQFTTSTSEVRLQRVADLMHRYGFTKSKVDAKTLIG